MSKYVMDEVEKQAHEWTYAFKQPDSVQLSPEKFQQLCAECMPAMRYTAGSVPTQAPQVTSIVTHCGSLRVEVLQGVPPDFIYVGVNYVYDMLKKLNVVR
jgi:hypothetical protein